MRGAPTVRGAGWILHGAADGLGTPGALRDHARELRASCVVDPRHTPEPRRPLPRVRVPRWRRHGDDGRALKRGVIATGMDDRCPVGGPPVHNFRGRSLAMAVCPFRAPARVSTRLHFRRARHQAGACLFQDRPAAPTSVADPGGARTSWGCPVRARPS